MQNDYIAIFMLNFYKLTFIPCLIGPSQVPPEKVDTYLAPVVKELNQLWEGVEAIDDKGPFTLKAVLMWGIHDYPGMRPNHKTLIQKSRTAKIAILQCAKPTTSHMCFARTSHKHMQLSAKPDAEPFVSQSTSHILHLEKNLEVLILALGNQKYHSREAMCET